MDKSEILPLFRVGGRREKTKQTKPKHFIRVHEALFFRKVSNIKPEYCQMPLKSREGRNSYSKITMLKTKQKSSCLNLY